MARFRASRFSKRASVAKPKPPEVKNEGGEEEEPTNVASAISPMMPAARPAPSRRPMSRRKPEPVEDESAVDDSVASPMMPAARPAPSRRPMSRPKPESVEDESAKVERIKGEATSKPEDERGPVETDPGSSPLATGGFADQASGYTADDFASKDESMGFGSTGTGSTDDAGADQVPTSTLGDAVGDSMSTPDATLMDPGEMTERTPEMPAGFDRTPSNTRSGNLSGLAKEADESTSMAGLGATGIAEEDPESTASPENTQTEDDYGKREYLEGNSDGVAQSLDIDNMSDAEVDAAVAKETDYAMAVEPGRAYLEGTGRGYNLDSMSDEDVAKALDAEAKYELDGGDGSGAMPPAPSYVESDSGSYSAQVSADAAKLGASGFNPDDPSTPGNIDPSEFGSGVGEDPADTSIIDVSDPSGPDAAAGSGSIGSAPPSAGVDFGPDHDYGTSQTGPYDTPGDIDFSDGTVDFEPESAGGGLLGQTFAADSPADEAGFALDDPTDIVDTAADDLTDDPRIDDIYQ